MENSSMTALISAFSRAWHHENNDVRVFDDPIARKLFPTDEYNRIAQNFLDGLSFFLPGFSGDPQQGLRRVVDGQLAPSPLGRAAFVEDALQTAARIGARQYLILGAGLDTFALRQPDWANALQIFEVDRPPMQLEKQERLAAAGWEAPGNLHRAAADLSDAHWTDSLAGTPFDPKRITFCSMAGLVYYLSEEGFSALLAQLSALLPAGSSLAFDYPCRIPGGPPAGAAKKQRALAAAAGEAMLAEYSYPALEDLLSRHHFLIYRHLDPPEITDEFFKRYNRAYPAHPIAALDNASFCLAVRQ